MAEHGFGRWSRAIGIALAAAIVAAACGGGSDSDSADGDTATTAAPATAAAPATTAAAATTAAPTTEAPFDIADIEPSVIRITTEGTFVDPQDFGQYSRAGVGTGFVISDDGIVVTNHHVVTGAGLVRAWVPGQDEPVNAQILGVSECSDLAVIDLEGDGYRALDWYEGDVTTGLDVFAAGYPLTDESAVELTDYTLTKGIVSSTSANGETPWASVDAVLEHDARIRGGNSGGPLVDEMGRIVAVNYAGIDADDQNFAIAGELARPIIDILRTGEDVDSLGINGQAVAGESVTGVFVQSVDSGSPADVVGVEPGDIITRLEGLVLGADGSMSTYCDVLRTNAPDEVLSIEVLRLTTEEVWEGRVNSGDPMELSFSFAQQFEEQAADTGDAPYADYVEVTDDTGAVRVSVPAEWSDTNGVPNENFGPSIFAAPSIEAFLGTWDTPGVIVEASPDASAGPDSVLDAIDFSDGCTDGGRQPYADPLYTGTLQVWLDCGGTNTVVLVLGAVPEDGSVLVRVVIQAVADRDLAAADRVLETFVATPG